MLTIGSRAFDMGRKPKDFDYIATPEELSQFKELNKERIVLAKPSKFGETIFMTGSQPIEIDTSETGQELLKIVAENNLSTFTCGQEQLADPEVLLALKLSHRYLKNSPHFLKTMSDVWHFRNQGVTVPDVLQDWLKRRSKVTYDYSHPSLNKSKEDFFTDNFPYLVEHDDIHKSVALYDEPAYLKIKEDKADVWCSKERFFSLSRDIQLATTYEESLVLSLERSLIPNYFKPDPFTAFKVALEKVCTSISSGWWRQFSWENYYDVIAMYNEDYVNKFHVAVARGEIRPYVGK